MAEKKVPIQKKKVEKTIAGRANPTKSQHQVLSFISNFINQHGYGPSYREIMRGCGYSTLSSVSMHVDALIMLGLLTKKKRGARSLQITQKNTLTAGEIGTTGDQNQKEASLKTYEKWLIEQVSLKFDSAERSLNEDEIDNLYILVGSLKILGFDAAAIAFKTRLAQILENLKKL